MNDPNMVGAQWLPGVIAATDQMEAAMRGHVEAFVSALDGEDLSDRARSTVATAQALTALAAGAGPNGIKVLAFIAASLIVDAARARRDAR